MSLQLLKAMPRYQPSVSTDSPETAKWLWRKEYDIFVKLFGFVYTSDLCFISIGDGVSLVPMRITLSMVAKCAISAIFIIVFLYTPEIFPTTIR